jgi:hypothetical protein
VWPWRKRLVRLHLADDQPSLEGVLCGHWAGHYVLKLAKILETADATVSLDGHSVRVPRERVVFVQVIR